MNRRLVISHLAIHAIAVGISTATLLSLVGPHLRFDVQVALVFLIVGVFAYPAQALMRSFSEVRQPPMWRWIAGVCTTALLIFGVTRLVYGA